MFEIARGEETSKECFLSSSKSRRHHSGFLVVCLKYKTVFDPDIRCLVFSEELETMYHSVKFALKSRKAENFTGARV